MRKRGEKFYLCGLSKKKKKFKNKLYNVLQEITFLGKGVPARKEGGWSR
jgi:hypothetical protein